MIVQPSTVGPATKETMPGVEVSLEVQGAKEGLDVLFHLLKLVFPHTHVLVPQ